MRVPFDFVLRLASKGDELASEVARLVIEAASNGIDTKIFFSFSGNSFTVIPIETKKTI